MDLLKLHPDRIATEVGGQAVKDTPKERSIPFSAESIPPTLDGRKTQTRRVIKRQPLRISDDWDESAEPGERVIYRGWPYDLYESNGRDKRATGELTPRRVRCPYGQPGDHLYVREPISTQYADGVGLVWNHVASPSSGWKIWPGAEPKRTGVLIPSAFMPKWAARIWLEITEVRVEQIQDIYISPEDMLAEGITAVTEAAEHLAYEFRELWDRLNTPRGYGWDANPWVWVIESKRIEP